MGNKEQKNSKAQVFFVVMLMLFVGSVYLSQSRVDPQTSNKILADREIASTGKDTK